MGDEMGKGNNEGFGNPLNARKKKGRKWRMFEERRNPLPLV